MATYVPNATQATEPVESRTVESAALEFRTLKGSVNGRVDALQADIDAEIADRLADAAALQAEVDAVEVRTLALEQLAFNGSTPGAVTVQRFACNGVQTVFVLAVTPVTVTAVDAYINGVYQNHDTFSVSGNTITFTEAPTAGAVLEMQLSVPLQLGTTTADAVEYTPAGTGAVATTVQSKLREAVSVLDFGAVGDDSTDNTAAIQFAINHVQVTNETLYFPPGTYRVTGAGLTVSGPISIVGAGNSASSIKNINGVCLNVSGTHVYVSDIAINSLGGGHTITQPSGTSLSQSSFVNAIIIQQGVTYSCWDNNGQEFLNNRFRDCEFYHGTVAAPASVPAFKLVSAGGNINDNVWETTRINGNNSNGYSFHIEATGVNHQYNNALRDITFECCNGGGIRLISCFAYEIINCTNWDADIYGPVRSHFYDIKSNASNYLSQGVIKGCYRWAGVNDTNVYDIKLGATCPGTVIEICGAGNYANAFIADLNSNNCVVVFPDIPTFAILNSANAIVLNDGGYIRAGKGVKGVLPVTPETYTFGSTNVPAARIVPNASGGTATLPTSMGALQWANAAGSSVYGVIDVLWDNPSASSRTGMVFSCNVNGSFAEGVRIQATDGAFLPGADNARQLGNASKRWSNLYATKIRTGNGGVFITSGVGSPEGIVDAPVGSMYTRTDGGAGTTLYVKESGTTALGWVSK